MKNKKGFTLVELLAVIVLISLIMVIVVPQVQKVAKQSKVKLCKSKITLAEETLNLWGQDNYRCFSREDGCNMLDNCDTIDDKIICSVKYDDLAKNNLVNYDQKINDVNTVINPIDNSSLNNLEFRVAYNSKTKAVNSTVSQAIDDICILKKENTTTSKSTSQTTSKSTSQTTSQTTSKSTSQTTSQTTSKINQNTTNVVTEQSAFQADSWSTIQSNIKNNNASRYHVGDVKQVYINNLGYFNVRVANNTTPSECKASEFSQTACGFVVEFVDIIEYRQMNSTDTNVGGWPSSSIRIYANGDFFNKFPSDLQNIIIDTKVISGHGNEDSDNFTSTDKIYLLSAKEIWNGGANDTALNITRQLDYYASKGVIVSDHNSVAIKKSNSSNTPWILRSASSKSNNTFLLVSSSGSQSSVYAGGYLGFSPAFRIG